LSLSGEGYEEKAEEKKPCGGYPRWGSIAFAMA
jgi:hypothetical protein